MFRAWMPLLLVAIAGCTEAKHAETQPACPDSEEARCREPLCAFDSARECRMCRCTAQPDVSPPVRAPGSDYPRSLGPASSTTLPPSPIPQPRP